MPSLGELQLFESNAPCSGGAFLATRAFTVGFDRNAAGVSVHARKGTRWVVVKLQNQPALPDLLSVALSEAQQGSDLLARRGHFVELDTPNTDHLIWWLDANGPRLRASHLTLFEAPKVNLDLQVVRADGSEAPPPPPVPWHPLLRFYRFAHLAEDPIERFRYLYLAIENAISTISPKVPRERESVWLQRVLRAQAIDCASVLQGQFRRQPIQLSTW